jgi:DNA-binding CsgD family transcriptional regulator/tetratricopeptide (TPR) repeat protein
MIQWPFASSPPPEPQGDAPLPLIGREREMDLLRHTLKAISQSGAQRAQAMPHVVFVAGAPGVGKTRLLRELVGEAASHNATVLWGGAYESSMLPPYLPFTEALRPYLHSLSSDQLRRLLGIEPSTGAPSEQAGSNVMSALSLRCLGQLFPLISSLVGTSGAHDLLAPEQEKFGLLDGIATLLERLAALDDARHAPAQPVLLCLDDLQWADSASLDLLLYLAARLRSASLLILGAFRSDAQSPMPDAGNPLGHVIAELNRQRLLKLLMLAPLSEGAASVFLDTLLPGGVALDLQQAILARAEGNPFFIEELVRALQSSGQITLVDGLWQRAPAVYRLSGPLPQLPPSIQTTLALRLEPLSAPCRDLLFAASLCGPTLYPDVLAAATGHDQETTLDLLDEAIAAGLIEPLPDNESAEKPLGPLPTFHFRQRMARELLAGQLPRHSRRRLHAALADALQRRARTREAAERYAAELAHHYAQAGRTQQAVHWTVRAGDVAAARHAQREAIGYYRTALAMLDSAPAPNGEAAAQDDQPALETYRPGQLHWRLGESWFRLGEFQSALRSFHAALEEERNSGDLLALAKLNRLISDAYRQAGQYDQTFGYLQAAQAALTLLEQQAPEDQPASHSNAALVEQMLLRQSFAILMIGAGQEAEAEQALRDSQQLAIRAGDRNGQAVALHLLGWVKGWGEHIGQSIQLQLQARELLQETGDPYHTVLGYQGLGAVYQAIGNAERAAAETETGLTLAWRYGMVRPIPWLRFNQGILALAQGRWDDARLALEEARDEGERLSDTRLKPIVYQALGVLAWRLGRLEEAEEALETSYRAAQITEWFPSSAALLGWFYAVTGRPDAAGSYLDQALGRHIFPPLGLAADFYLPFAAEGRLACNQLEQATKLAERIRPWSDRQYYGVSAARVLGRIAAAQGHWTEARSHFAAALELCRRAGSRAEQGTILLDWASAALAEAGATPVRASVLADDVERLSEEAETLFTTLKLPEQAAKAAALSAEAEKLSQQAAKAPGAGTLDPAALKGMTPREIEVLRLVAEGMTDKEIAEALVISPRTANRHIANIFLKIDVTTRAAAAAYAIRHQIV